jgi:hypothetical protein
LIRASVSQGRLAEREEATFPIFQRPQEGHGPPMLFLRKHLHRIREGSLWILTVLIGSRIAVSDEEYEKDESPQEWEGAEQDPPAAMPRVVKPARKEAKRDAQRLRSSSRGKHAKRFCRPAQRCGLAALSQPFDSYTLLLLYLEPGRLLLRLSPQLPINDGLDSVEWNIVRLRLNFDGNFVKCSLYALVGQSGLKALPCDRWHAYCFGRPDPDIRSPSTDPNTRIKKSRLELRTAACKAG